MKLMIKKFRKYVWEKGLEVNRKVKNGKIQEKSKDKGEEGMEMGGE